MKGEVSVWKEVPVSLSIPILPLPVPPDTTFTYVNWGITFPSLNTGIDITRTWPGLSRAFLLPY